MAEALSRPQTRSSAKRRADSSSRAYVELRRRLVAFGFKPDERVSEVQVAKLLGLSRTPVREALTRLASEGFLVAKPNKGFFFRALDLDDLVQLSEFRSVIEVGAFGIACARAGDADIRSVAEFWRNALARYADGDVDEILGLDEEFHRRIAALSGNEAIVRALDGVTARLRFVRRVFIERGASFPTLVEDHGRLLAALEARDPDQGAAILRTHMSMTVEDARAAIKEALFRLYVK